MILMFSARRLKPGAWDQVRRAWDSGVDRLSAFVESQPVEGVYEVVDVVDE